MEATVSSQIKQFVMRLPVLVFSKMEVRWALTLNKQTVAIFIVLQEIEDADVFHVVALLSVVQDAAG